MTEILGSGRKEREQEIQGATGEESTGEASRWKDIYRRKYSNEAALQKRPCSYKRKKEAKLAFSPLRKPHEYWEGADIACENCILIERGGRTNHGVGNSLNIGRNSDDPALRARALRELYWQWILAQSQKYDHAKKAWSRASMPTIADVMRGRLEFQY